MAVKIRLTRMGAKKAPFYRIVATDSRNARDAQYLEKIGHYNPNTNPAEVKIDAEIAKKWLGYGAQMTDTVRDLFFKAGIIGGKAEAKAPEAVEEKKTDAPIED